MISIGRVEAALASARAELVAACPECNHWESELPGSPFATAAAVVALALAESASSQAGIQDFESQLSKGQDWLVKQINADGGWGDAPGSPSNAVATALCWASLAVNLPSEAKYAAVIAKADAWLRHSAGTPAPTGELTVEFLLSAMSLRHGNDLTLSVPVLTACALTGRFEESAWKAIPRFPFEMAGLPRSWFRLLSLPAASHALPAMLAMGLTHHLQAATWNPIVKSIRQATRTRALALLDKIQPSSGGFLESTPLTSFVVMGLSALGLADNLAAKKGLAFLLRSQQDDGSWPIDSNLDTRATTLAANALLLTGTQMPVESLQDWLLDQQFGGIHPGTNAAPGGWSWTHLPGGVPDAKDTAETLLALKGIARFLPVPKTAKRHFAAQAGVLWLLNLQNGDGGVSTFTRSRSKLAVDRSSADVTAHAIRAWLAWRRDFPALKKRIDKALSRALSYLRASQNPDGSWPALWYGSGRSPEGDNLTCGVSRAVLALVALKEAGFAKADGLLKKALEWLVKTQLADGGWAAGNGGVASVEETAWAVEGLAMDTGAVPDGNKALGQGLEWLVARVESGRWKTAAPLGFHFARVGYSEPLFPEIFTVAALARARASLTRSAQPR